MREIKFRGKRFDNGEWVYGAFIPDALETLGVKEIDWGFIKYWDNKIKKGFTIEVERKTVGQYTCRTAQCIDEIYEGDICEVTRFDHNGVDTQYKCVVEYIDGSFAFVFEKNEYKHVFWFNEVYDTDSDVVVIGNIHDKEGE